MHTYIHTSMHAYIHTSMHAYIHTYIHTYIHRYIHVYIYIYICRRACLKVECLENKALTIRQFPVQQTPSNNTTRTITILVIIYGKVQNSSIMSKPAFRQSQASSRSRVNHDLQMQIPGQDRFFPPYALTPPTLCYEASISLSLQCFQIR